MNKRDIPIYELFVEDSEDIGLALVGMPAIEQDFMYFNEEPVKMQFNDEKQMIVGPALIPNQLIYRNDTLGERYIYFSEETIVKFVELLMSKEKNKFNLGHTDNYLDAILIESYFAKEDNEFNVAKGSWIVGLKVRDIDVWEQIKNGDFKGFSVQSLFSNELISFNKLNNNNKDKENMSKLKEKISTALNSVLFPDEKKVDVKDEALEAISEVSIWSVEVSNTSFEIGDVVSYDYDGETYPVGAGEFRLKDGSKIVTDASGVIVSKEAGEVAEPVVEEVKEEVKEEEFEEAVEEVKEDEEVEKSVDEKLADMKAEILEEVKAMIEAQGEEVTEGIEELSKKIVEFGNQPIVNKKQNEVVNNPRQKRGSKAAQYFNK